MEVGDYVRIADDRGTQFIGKIYNINEFREPSTKYAVDCQIFNDYAFVGDERIVKSSPNIIDLIEVGDYVNGCLVSEIKDKWLILNYADIETYEQLERKNGNIKSIVTKEQFSSMEYKVN